MPERLLMSKTRIDLSSEFEMMSSCAMIRREHEGMAQVRLRRRFEVGETVKGEGQRERKKEREKERDRGGGGGKREKRDIERDIERIDKNDSAEQNQDFKKPTHPGTENTREHQTREPVTRTCLG
jgi:hypothetical protein